MAWENSSILVLRLLVVGPHSFGKRARLLAVWWHGCTFLVVVGHRCEVGFRAQGFLFSLNNLNYWGGVAGEPNTANTWLKALWQNAAGSPGMPRAC